MKSHLSLYTARIAGIAVITGLFTLPSIAAPGGSPTVRYFKASIAPATNVQAGAATAFSVTITNCDASTCDSSHATTSSQSMGSATIAVPPGFSSVTSLSTSATAAKSWNASLDGASIKLVASTGTQKLIPGEAVTVSFNAIAPCDASSYSWTSVGYNGTDYATAYDLYGSQPSLEVTGSCLSFTGWQPGDYCTYGQGGWGTEANGNNPGAIRDENFEAVYINGVTVGTGNSMTFEQSLDVENFLPGCKTPAALTGTYTNPLSVCKSGPDAPPNYTGGIFGAQVLALKLNSDFNTAGVLASNLNDFSGLVLVDTNTSLDGQTIASILDAAEVALGGGALPAGYSIELLNTLADAINQAFSECEPSEWAQAHLMPY